MNPHALRLSLLRRLCLPIPPSGPHAKLTIRAANGQGAEAAAGPSRAADDIFARVARPAPDTLAPPSDAPEGEAPTSRRARLRAALGRRGLLDGLVCLAFVLVAAALSAGLWPDPTTRVLRNNVGDQVLIEWFLAHGTLVWTGDFSLVTDRLNAPNGVNLMSNASHILHGVLMAPVTAVFGAAVSFAVLVALNLAATGAAWYLLFARTLGMHRAGAAVGAALVAFGPGMMSQSNSHLHITAQWLVPPMVWCLLRLTRVRATRDVVLTAVGLALLVTAQVFLGEEVLFLTALTLLIFIPVYALGRRTWARAAAPTFLRGVGIATGIAGRSTRRTPRSARPSSTATWRPTCRSRRCPSARPRAPGSCPPGRRRRTRSSGRCCCSSSSA